MLWTLHISQILLSGYHVPLRRDRIISAVNASFLKWKHKFGTIPSNVRAKIIDDANGNTLWQDAIAKEMNAVRVAFKIG